MREKRNKGDKTIICLCGKPFPFTVGEQRFYKEKGFVLPKRCPDCRAKKKREQQNIRREPWREDVPFPMGEER